MHAWRRHQRHCDPNPWQSQAAGGRSSTSSIPASTRRAYGLPLEGVYVVWPYIVALLYPWVRWMAGVKTRSRAWWLSYV